MGKPRSSKEQPNAAKRTRSQAELGDEPAEGVQKLLSNNKFAALPVEDSGSTTKKEKMPPFYTKGFPDKFREEMKLLISKGLQAKYSMCTDGYKIMVPGVKHYNAVQEYLKRKKVYFTHDIAANKPFKIVLRGLPDMEIKEVQDGLVECNLKVLAVHKNNRRNKNITYRDQLYLIHLERGSINLAGLNEIKDIDHTIVKWERYKPIHRDVTQCTNCLNFGHGAKNCFVQSRCNSCGGNHHTNECIKEDATTKCVHCGEDNPSTSRQCLKRAEFIEKRKKASANNNRNMRNSQNHRMDVPPHSHSRRNIPVLTPLPLPTASRSSMITPSNRGDNMSAQSTSRTIGSPPGVLSFAQVVAGKNQTTKTESDDLYTPEQMSALLAEFTRLLRACKTKQDQVTMMMDFAYKYGQPSP